MTIEALDRTQYPSPVVPAIAAGRKIGIRTIASVAIITLIGVTATVAVILASSTGPALSPYEAEMQPLVVQHNDLMVQWNTFLAEYSAIPRHMPEEIDARAVTGRDLTQMLATEAEAVIRSWDKVTPPAQFAEAHAISREAMRVTQTGFIELGIYFDDIVRHGIAFDDQVKAGVSRLAYASELWAEARAAAAIEN